LILLKEEDSRCAKQEAERELGIVFWRVSERIRDAGSCLPYTVKETDVAWTSLHSKPRSTRKPSFAEAASTFLAAHTPFGPLTSRHRVRAELSVSWKRKKRLAYVKDLRRRYPFQCARKAVREIRSSEIQIRNLVNCLLRFSPVLKFSS